MCGEETGLTNFDMSEFLMCCFYSASLAQSIVCVLNVLAMCHAKVSCRKGMKERERNTQQEIWAVELQVI